MTLRTLTLSLLASVAVVGAGVGAAQAQQVAALVGDRTIAVVDTAAKKVSRTMTVSGVAGRLAGIDVRPADGMLYGVVEDGTVVTIDTRTGKAMAKSKLEMMIPPGVAATVDFNPVADRLRLIGADGMSLRANVDDGKVVQDGSLKFADTDMHKGEKPMVTAGAYSNSFKGTKETALYDIDTKIGGLLKQAPPNDGILNAIGKLGIKSSSVAFDIASDGQGGNSAWLMAGKTLYSVDLASGKATKAADVKGVKGTVRDIAILPKAM